MKTTKILEELTGKDGKPGSRAIEALCAPQIPEPDPEDAHEALSEFRSTQAQQLSRIAAGGIGVLGNASQTGERPARFDLRGAGKTARRFIDGAVTAAWVLPAEELAGEADRRLQDVLRAIATGSTNPRQRKSVQAAWDRLGAPQAEPHFYGHVLAYMLVPGQLVRKDDQRILASKLRALDPNGLDRTSDDDLVRWVGAVLTEGRRRLGEIGLRARTPPTRD